jgi:hypothetical protein
MHERKRQFGGVEGFDCQVEHDRAVFANGVEHEQYLLLDEGMKSYFNEEYELQEDFV